MAYYASSMINHPFLFLRIFPSAFPSVRFLAAAVASASLISNREMYLASSTESIVVIETLARRENFRTRWRFERVVA